MAMNSTLQELLAEMELSDEEIARRMAWLEFTEQDADNLSSLNEIAREYIDDVIENLYRHFLSFEETRNFFSDPETLQRVKNLQKAYFLRMTEGNYDNQYVRERLKIGAVHQHIGLDVKWYLGAYNFYMRDICSRLFHTYKDQPEKALEFYFSLKKLVFLDIGLATEIYLTTIRRREEEIRELSTPVLQVRQGLLILPIIGVLDPVRSQQLTGQLLRAIRVKRAKVVVVDVTGVPSLNSEVANHLVQTVEASRLMGANVIVTGLSATNAQTLATLGMDLTKMQALGDLQSGIEAAELMLGYRVTRQPPKR